MHHIDLFVTCYIINDDCNRRVAYITWNKTSIRSTKKIVQKQQEKLLLT